MRALGLISACFLALCFSSALIAEEGISSEARNAGSYKELTWDDLMPEGWVPTFPDPSEIFHSSEPSEGDGFDQIEIDIPNDTDIAPVVESLDKQWIKLPGYMIPTKYSGEYVEEFLLVPYLGACIHVPPPPANQMVYVTLAEPRQAGRLWEPVWVSGVMNTELAFNQYATAGYHMKQATTEVYVY